MDKNKLKVLQLIKYVVRDCCGSCDSGYFPNNDWGTCKMWTYKHEKHTGEQRNLSITKFGYCDSYSVDQTKTFDGFEQLREVK